MTMTKSNFKQFHQGFLTIMPTPMKSIVIVRGEFARDKIKFHTISSSSHHNYATPKTIGTSLIVTMEGQNFLMCLSKF